MKTKLLFSCLLIVGSMGVSFAQDTPDPTMTARIREEGMNHSQVMDIAFHLTDANGPRLAGSPGLKRAQEWIVSQLKTWGMVNVAREPYGKFGKGWEIQKSYAAITVPYYHALIGVPKAWTPGTKGAINTEVVYFKADSTSDLEKYKGKLKGKIIITDAPAPAEQNFKTPEAARYTDAELDVMAKATMPPAGAGGAAGRRPAAGPGAGGNRITPAQLTDFEVAEGVGLVLSQARGTDGTVFTGGGNGYRDSSKMAAPQFETSAEDYQRILRLVKGGQKVTMEADIKAAFFDNDMQGYNVVGEIPGTDPKLKEQLVMIGGHLDSWHAGTGATDNAAGCSVILEVMRILSRVGYHPKRTIRIALWSGEEEGLLGSRGYVTNHFGNRATMALKPDQSKVSAYYNIDNGTGKVRGVYLQGNAAAGPIFQQWLAPFKDMGATTVTISNTGGTDHQSFDAVGIPGFQFIQDPMDYSSRTHHSNQDTYDKLSEADLKQMATIVASFVYNTSERQEMIPRKELPKPAVR